MSRLAPMLAVVLVFSVPPADAAAGTFYVRAVAEPGGDGSRSSPLHSLAAVEKTARRGDTIVVLSSPRDAPPLDGGIRLKPHQSLVGRGRAPRIANTDPERHKGDAVRLARGAVVRNLAIVGAVRGGIYGKNVKGVVVRGNDVSAHNSSCTPGFHIPPFNVPTTAPGVGIPISGGLINGWAGIMLDANRGRGRARILGNRVHSAECGDGIDVRLSKTARVRVKIAGNDVRDLRQGADHESVLAIGLQTAGNARLVARVNRNVQTNLGNEEDAGAGPEGADSEGVFINPTGGSSLRASVANNEYTNPNGLGGFSANGLEFVAMGDGSRGHVRVRDSTFAGTPGDVLEQLALGTNAHLSLELVNVTAERSTGHGGTGFGNTVLIPGNNADCLLSASGGAGNQVDLVVRDSRLTDCANNGITFGSAVANGEGPTARLSMEMTDTTITGNQGANLRVGNETELDELLVKVERSNLSDSEGAGSGVANVSFEELGTTTHSQIDLGGGALGSAAQNCLVGGNLAAYVMGYEVSAVGNWWGTPGGPAPGRTVVAGGSLADSPALDAAPAGVC